MGIFASKEAIYHSHAGQKDYVGNLGIQCVFRSQNNDANYELGELLM